MENHLLPTLGATPTKAITYEKLEAVVEAASVQRKVVAKARAGSVRRGGDTAVRELVVMLKLLFRYAVKRKATSGVDSSPADSLDAEDFGVPPPSKRQRFLSDAEMAAFLTSI